MTTSKNYQSFWSWFQANEKLFPPTEKFYETYGSELSENLKNINPDLTYEIGVHVEEENELIISADGLKELIPVVQHLVEAAPKIDGWKFKAFRPRLDDYEKVELNFSGRVFQPKTMWCWSNVDDGNFDLTIYHPEYDEENENLIVAGSYILLDMALGEYDVMTRVRYIDHQQLPENPEQAGLYKFEELRDIFDSFKAATTH